MQVWSSIELSDFPIELKQTGLTKTLQMKRINKTASKQNAEGKGGF